jgi:hypothetical protein
VDAVVEDGGSGAWVGLVGEMSRLLLIAWWIGGDVVLGVKSGCLSWRLGWGLGRMIVAIAEWCCKDDVGFAMTRGKWGDVGTKTRDARACGSRGNVISLATLIVCSL